MPKARLYFDGDNTGIEKEAREYSLTQAVEDKLDSIDTIETTLQGEIDDLQDQIDNLASRGRYLSTWDCVSGLPDTSPQTDPYVYRAGDYYIVSTAGGTNYRPNGSEYHIGVASQVVESLSVSQNDLYIYDGIQWILQQSGSSLNAVWGSITGTLSAQTDLQNALNTKASAVDLNTKIFPLSTTVGQTAINEAQAILDWYLDGKYPIVQYGAPGAGFYGTYTLMPSPVGVLRFQMTNNLFTSNHNDNSSIGTREITINYSGSIVSGVSGRDNRGQFLRTDGFNDDNYVPTEISHPANKKYVDDGLSNKQATLVSGTNIKSINNNSLLGSGDLSIAEVPSGGTNGDVLTNVSGTPTWQAPSGGDVLVSTQANNIFTPGMKIWGGTESDYQSLTPDSNTAYLLLAGGPTPPTPPTPQWEGDFSKWQQVQQINAPGIWAIGVSMKPDGTILYVAHGNKIRQYALSTAFDLTTATSTGEVSMSCEGLFFKPDGTKLYIINNDVYQYDLTTPRDITTATNMVTGPNLGGRGVYITPDGTTVFASDSYQDYLCSQTLSTPRDLSTADGNTVTQSGGQGNDLWFGDGGKIYISQRGESTQYLTYKYLATPYDLSGVTSTGDINIGRLMATGLRFNPTGTICITCGGGSSTNYIRKYTLS